MNGRQVAQRVGLGVLVLVNLAGAGSAVAAAAIGSAQIVDGGVRSRDVRDGTLRAQDLAPGTAAALRGETGPRGARGEPGEKGGSGPTSIAQTVSFYGPVQSIAALSPVYVFAGAPVQVTTTATHPRVTAAASAALGYATGTAASVADLGLCYRLASGGIVLNFYGGNFGQYGFSGARLPYTATASVVLAPGSWLVGLCVRNGSDHVINNNNYVNGYAQVTQ